MKVFASGSCRIVSLVHDGWDLINPIHSWIGYYDSINYLSFYHNSKQHIQFIKYIKNLIDIPDDCINNIMIGGNEELDNMRKERISNLRNEFNSCDVYIFEICSLKIKKINDFYINLKDNNSKYDYIQTNEELYNDLSILRKLINIDKKIIFVSHFRPNLIYNDESKKIISREIIFNTIKQFCENNIDLNVLYYDPSNFINSHINYLSDNYHYNEKYIKESFENLYYNYMK